MVDAAPTVFRSTTNRVIAICGWVLAAVGAVASAVNPSPTGWLALVPLALVALLAYEVFWRPRLVIDDDGVVLVNIFHTITVPWTIVVNVDTRWALTLVTPKRRYRSAAAPAPGAMSRPRTGRDSTNPRVGGDGIVRKADALGTDSGDAAYVVRERWQRLIDSERIPLGRGQTDRATTRLHLTAAVAVLVLTVASVPAILAL